MIKISIELIRDWLKAHAGREYSIQELGKHLKINASVFANCRTIYKLIKKGIEKEIKCRKWEDEYGITRGKVFWIDKEDEDG